VNRCDVDGVANDEGTYFKMAFSWATDKNVVSIVVEWKPSSTSTWASSSIAASGTSGTSNSILGAGAISTESSYDVTLVVTDEVGSSTVTRSIPSLAYAIDFKAGGKGVAIGKPAATDNLFDVALPTSFRKDVTVYALYDKFETKFPNGLAAYTGSGDSGIDPDTTLESLILTNNNVPGDGGFMFICTMFYNTKSVTATRIQIAIPYNQFGNTYRRYYNSGTWSEWRNTALDSHPVHSFYIAYSHTSPAEEFGGTWTRISERFLYACPEDATIGLTAGEKTHTLTVSEMPSHTHTVKVYARTVYATGAAKTAAHWSEGDGTKNLPTPSYTGGGAAHNNMPPYVYVSIWRRIE
jgi:hypothetical protein